MRNVGGLILFFSIISSISFALDCSNPKPMQDAAIGAWTERFGQGGGTVQPAGGDAPGFEPYTFDKISAEGFALWHVNLQDDTAGGNLYKYLVTTDPSSCEEIIGTPQELDNDPQGS